MQCWWARWASGSPDAKQQSGSSDEVSGTCFGGKRVWLKGSRVCGVERQREANSSWQNCCTFLGGSLSWATANYSIAFQSAIQPTRLGVRPHSPPLHRADSLRNFRPLIDVLFIISSHIHKIAVSRKDFKPVNLFSHLEREMQRKSTFLDLNFNVASILWDNLKR